ncbi:hypothetical protein BDZ97DRAFT_1754962 [Flammula alnicola]|nr:hypothetical protein BDZ97DRAFT_1754962 [Flammula alnicola]
MCRLGCEDHLQLEVTYSREPQFCRATVSLAPGLQIAQFPKHYSPISVHSSTSWHPMIISNTVNLSTACEIESLTLLHGHLSSSKLNCGRISAIGELEPTFNIQHSMVNVQCLSSPLLPHDVNWDTDNAYRLSHSPLTGQQCYHRCIILLVSSISMDLMDHTIGKGSQHIDIEVAGSYFMMLRIEVQLDNDVINSILCSVTILLLAHPYVIEKQNMNGPEIRPS